MTTTLRIAAALLGNCAPSLGTEPSDLQHRKADHTGVPPASQSEPKEAGADEALADFQFYGGKR